MLGLFNTLIFDPLYNALVFVIGVLPTADVGMAVIILTILVKLLLFPLARRAVHTQEAMKAIAPKAEAIKKKYENDKQAFANATMSLYKEHNVRPFASFFIILIQLPIIIGLYWVFLRGGLPDLNSDILYSFTPRPETVNMVFLGVVSVAGKSFVLALLAGVTQFVHAYFAIQPPPPAQTPSFKDDFARSVQLQMRYVLPVIVGIFAYTTSAAVALYFVTANIFTIAQEWFIRRSLSKATALASPATAKREPHQI